MVPADVADITMNHSLYRSFDHSAKHYCPTSKSKLAFGVAASSATSATLDVSIQIVAEPGDSFGGAVFVDVGLRVCSIQVNFDYSVRLSWKR